MDKEIKTKNIWTGRHVRIEDKLVLEIEARATANRRSFVGEVNAMLELFLGKKLSGLCVDAKTGELLSDD